MNTFSHLIVNGALARPLKRKMAGWRLPPWHTGAFLLGSIAPDIPLTLIAVILGAYDLFFGAGLPRPDDPAAASSLMGQLFNDWFFHDPWIITAQNLLQSPLLLLLYLFLAYWFWRRGRLGGWLFCFAAGCLLHTLGDIPLHHDDGPLLLFPLNWEWRFFSPISYWDPAHYGRQWGRLELILDVLLLLYLAVLYRSALLGWWRRRWSRQ